MLIIVRERIHIELIFRFELKLDNCETIPVTSRENLRLWVLLAQARLVILKADPHPLVEVILLLHERLGIVDLSHGLVHLDKLTVLSLPEAFRHTCLNQVAEPLLKTRLALSLGPFAFHDHASSLAFNVLLD